MSTPGSQSFHHAHEQPIGGKFPSFSSSSRAARSGFRSNGVMSSVTNASVSSTQRLCPAQTLIRHANVQTTTMSIQGADEKRPEAMELH